MWYLLLFLLGYILLCFLIVTIFYILNIRAYDEGLPKHYADYIIFYTEYILVPSEAILKRIGDWNPRNVLLVHQ